MAHVAAQVATHVATNAGHPFPGIPHPTRVSFRIPFRKLLDSLPEKLVITFLPGSPPLPTPPTHPTHPHPQPLHPPCGVQWDEQRQKQWPADRNIGRNIGRNIDRNIPSGNLFRKLPEIFRNPTPPHTCCCKKTCCCSPFFTPLQGGI